ncbi:MAG: hypothetical protein JXR03_09290 [Cyclobacteriaceae bacterium]
MKRNRNKNRIRIARILLIVIVIQVVQSPVVYALTGGPSQPEIQSFSQAGTTEMVDLFTGDFSYNIPLFEVPGPNGGYPFSLSYRAGIGMDQEASWVGLGWTLSPGAISRQVRGLPDDFNGDADIVSTTQSMKPNMTIGSGIGAGAEIFGGDLNLSLNYSSFVNTYKGNGISVGGNLGLSQSTKSGATAGVGLGFSLNSQEGAMLEPSLSLGKRSKENSAFSSNFMTTLSAGYHSRQGLYNVSLGTSASVVFSSEKHGKIRGGNQTSSSLSILSKAYTPAVRMPMKNISRSVTFKVGGAAYGFYPFGSVNGFSNIQIFDNNEKTVEAFGYLNYQNAKELDMLDFNRENDGIVRKENSNLPIPSLTYDIYSATGQGISAMYRPIRNDIGIVHDQKLDFTSDKGLGIGIDVGLVTHVGANGSFSKTRSYSGLWEEGTEDLRKNFGFRDTTENTTFEPYFFKVHGEKNSSSYEKYAALGADAPARPLLDNNKKKPKSVGMETSEITENGDFDFTTLNNDDISDAITSSRHIRAQSVNAIKNGVLKDVDNMPLFNIDQHTNSSGAFNRNNVPENHIGGYEVTDLSGVRYMYALPAYTKKQVECQYSVAPSDDGISTYSPPMTLGKVDLTNLPGEQYYNRTEMSEYAHAHMLTAIVGPDYVDVGDDGLDDKDIGYWVKFTYDKVSDYKWRSPYYGGFYDPGVNTNPADPKVGDDDKASYVYGEKDIWYLSAVETKSHYALFTTEDREDGLGAISEHQYTEPSDFGTAAKQLKLSDIALYAKHVLHKESDLNDRDRVNYDVLIKRVLFDYSSLPGETHLCSGLPNSAEGGGKLTLKRLRFAYGKYGTSQNAESFLTPYEFFYEGLNPNYDPMAYDRWGNYKPYGSTYRQNKDFPYVNQESNPTSKEDLDKHMAAWSITRIKTPSGGEILVDYESDDYAYVQHKEAMQMVKIVDPNSLSDSGDYVLSETDGLKLAFPLDDVIRADKEGLDPAEEIKKYIDPDEFLYFKAKIRLAGSGTKEIVSGYVNVDETMGFELLPAGASEYTHGAFYLKMEGFKKPGIGEKEYRNPISMRAWQHLKANRSVLISKEQHERVNMTFSGIEGYSTSDVVGNVRSVFSIFPLVMELVEGYYDYVKGKGWGRDLVLGESWIKVKSADKVKYGGGLRVKQLTMKDSWVGGDQSYYGQVYDYGQVEDGLRISSGVAAYEPISGGEENALRTAKKVSINVPLHSNNNMFFEYPINESYYSGPSVGYSKVTVKSIAAAYLEQKRLESEGATPNVSVNFPDGDNIFPTQADAKFGTTGMTEHEFYTAKDFPYITDETPKRNKTFNLFVPIPLLGTISINRLASSQGYAITTNDMHGKMRAVRNYRQSTEGIFDESPFSFVEYEYRSKKQFLNGVEVSVPENTFSAVYKLNNSSNKHPYEVTVCDEDAYEPSYCATGEKVLLGVEEEFFLDLRRHTDTNWGTGVNTNLDIVMAAFFPIPIPTGIPNISSAESTLKTAVANKIIFRSGILDQVVAYDNGSRVVTKNLKYDRYTGKTLLTRVNNNFDDPIYNYSKPAYHYYSGMGPVSQSEGLTFDMTVTKRKIDNGFFFGDEVAVSIANENEYFTQVHDAIRPYLNKGDELLVFKVDAEGATLIVGRATYKGISSGSDLIFTNKELETGSDHLYRATVIRSGFKNQLSVDAGTIQALNDPSYVD